MEFARGRTSALRAYIGLEPPLTTRRSVSAALARLSSAPAAAWVGLGHFHVTLRFLGDVPAESRDFDHLRNACAKIARRRVHFGAKIQLFGPNALVVPVTGADDLATAARATVRKEASAHEPLTFFGHMTVALPTTAGELEWASSMLGAPLSGGWDVDEVCVFASETLCGAKRYRVLARIPLAGTAAVRER
ncbi:2'-5' RNA ligase family protein [Amycolatopsis sp. CA-161197]|uniref:2'-5' RNA ligase family protein n=1 Tax=Amycolatopsis sp. CA-161197 TaxID=3239922 RepID=UPI003D8B2300